jgi:hypothetical protein
MVSRILAAILGNQFLHGRTVILDQHIFFVSANAADAHAKLPSYLSGGHARQGTQKDFSAARRQFYRLITGNVPCIRHKE